MIRIVSARTLRRMRNAFTAERIRRTASDNTAAALLDEHEALVAARLAQGLPPDATVEGLLRHVRSNALLVAGFDSLAIAATHRGLKEIAKEAQAIVNGDGVLPISCAIRIRDRAFQLLGAKTPDEQMDVLRS